MKVKFIEDKTINGVKYDRGMQYPLESFDAKTIVELHETGIIKTFPPVIRFEIKPEGLRWYAEPEEIIDEKPIKKGSKKFGAD